MFDAVGGTWEQKVAYVVSNNINLNITPYSYGTVLLNAESKYKQIDDLPNYTTDYAMSGGVGMLEMVYGKRIEDVGYKKAEVFPGQVGSLLI